MNVIVTDDGFGPDTWKQSEVLDLASNSDPETLTVCLLYTSPSPRDVEESRMPSSA